MGGREAGEVAGERVKLELALAALTVVVAVAGLAALVAPVITFSGGAEGWIALAGYKVVYLGEEAESGVLDKVQAVALLAGAALLLQPAVPLLSRRGRSELAAGLAALPLSAAAAVLGLIGVVEREASFVTVSNSSTTAGFTAFPAIYRAEGPARVLALLLLALAIAELALAALLYLRSPRSSELPIEVSNPP
jgi:hypothetical protein